MRCDSVLTSWARLLDLPRAASLVLLSGVLVGCATDDGREGGSDAVTVVRTDSASVELLTDSRTTAALPEVWTLASQPVLTLGDADGAGPFLFSRIGDVVPLPGGLVAVADGGSRELRLFNGDGTHVRSVGGAGEGPGRFGSIDDVRRVGPDTLVIWDSRNLRVSRVTPEEGFLGSVPLEVSAGFPPPRAEVLHDGGIVVTSELPDVPDLSREGWQIRHDSLLVQQFTAEGQEVQTIGRFEGVSRASGVVVMGDGRIAIQQPELPFGNRTITASLGQRIIIGNNRDFALKLFDRLGTLEAIWRFPGLLDPLGSDEVQQFREAAGDGPRARTTGELLEQFGTSSERPAFDRILQAAEDEIWVRRYRWDSGEDQVWWVISTVGDLLGFVRVPAHLEVRAVDASRVFTVTEDELGVQRIEIFPLTMGSVGWIGG